MKKYFLYSFFLSLAADLAANFFAYAAVRYISKPLIIISLIGYFIFSNQLVHSRVKNFILAALILSLAGDILLLFDNQGSLFFILGLSAFLATHIFYILSFNKIRQEERVEGNLLLLLPAFVYYGSFIFLLFPHLAGMKLPVIVYGFVIAVMLVAATHLMFIKNKKAGRLIAGGAMLFIVSDSLLAINKFYASFENAGVAIMLSYGLAQWLIVSGAIRYLADSAALKISDK